MTLSNNLDRNAVQDFFSANADEYAKLFLAKPTGANFSFRERLKLALQMTAQASGKMLDCACGTGEITSAILSTQRFSSATVVDLSPRMLEAARQRMELKTALADSCRREFVASDIFAFDIQTRAQQYDLILCLGLIAHTGRLPNLLGRLKTLLADGGSILLQSSLLDHPGHRVIRFFTQERYHRKHGYRISYFSHQDILLATREAGLKIVEARRFTFGVPFGDRISGSLNHRLEKGMEKWSHSHGAEALYLLKQMPNECTPPKIGIT